MDQRALVDEIRLAFADGRYPGDDNITRCTYDKRNGGRFDGPCGECEDIRLHFTGRRWEDLDARYLRREEGSLSAFTPETVAYFLPAYMVQSLLDLKELDVCYQFMINLLSDAGGSGKIHLVLPLLDAKKKRVLVDFLTYLFDLPDSEYEARDILAAIDIIKSSAAGNL